MVTWRQLFLLCLLLVASRSSLRAASFAETRAYRTATNAFYDGMWLRAEHELEQFGERFPRSEFLAEAVLLRAQAQYHQTNSASSIALLTANLDRAGSLADEYRFWIASGLYQQGNFSLAKFYIERAVDNLEKEHDPGVILEHYGDILLALKNEKKALEMWQKAWDSGKTDEELKIKIEKANLNIENVKENESNNK